MEYLPVEEAAKRVGDEGFLRNVWAAVIPRLIAKGLLHGKEENQCQLVADDDALARLAGMGVEKFVYNQQGYSFMVVRAPIDDVSQKLAARPGVATCEARVTPLPMQDDVGLQPDEQVRHAFLLQMRDTPEWSVVLQTIHWFQACDAIMVTALASALSADFQTLAAAAWDDDFSGSSLIVCENGSRQEVLADEDEEDGWVSFYEFFYEHGIAVPESFIGTENGRTALYVTDPAAVQRADHIVLKVPGPVKSTGPHVFDKIGMMAKAVAEGLDDESAFLDNMRGDVWRQAQAITTNGQF